MINNERLNAAIAEVKEDMQSKFEHIHFKMEPYYCGMGYVGLEILLDDVYSDHQIKEFEDYYVSKFEKKFFDYKITKFSEASDEFKPNEVRILGENGKMFNPI